MGHYTPLKTVWNPMVTAPRDGTEIDIYAKKWNSYTDTFIYKRFINCHYEYDFPNSFEDKILIGIDISFYPIYWKLPPEPPKGINE